uniref:Uncharacterized protein n=1 Tax=Triticum urartu TaxID=4572 RepID=A0A8R7UIE6_TRIUA
MGVGPYNCHQLHINPLESIMIARSTVAVFSILPLSNIPVLYAVVSFKNSLSH